MKINKLIEELKQVKQKHGNIKVGIQTLVHGVRPVNEVEQIFATFGLRKKFEIKDNENADIVRLKNDFIREKHNERL